MSIAFQNNKTVDLFTAFEQNKPKILVYKKNLQPVNNLKSIFREIRDYFVGNVTGITRDEKIAQNIMRLLFCKIFDEQSKKEDDLTNFSNRPNEQLSIFSQRINFLFEQVKNKYSDIFSDEEKIEINGKELSFIISKIENYSIINAQRDVVGDAFEELIGTSFRGGEGQFFTPRNIVEMMVEMMQPKGGEKILDPACGSGGFLAYTFRYLFNKKEKDFSVCGIDKDSFLAKLAKIYLILLGSDSSHIFCENSLDLPLNWQKETKEKIQFNYFDLILTNPPFGSKIPVVGKELLGQYDLGYGWAKVLDKWEKGKSLLSKQPPQVLFIERCLQLLKDGGRLGIVLPEGIFGNPSDKYIWEYITRNASIMAVVSLSQEAFQPSTHTKTSILFLKKNNTKKTVPIFMAIADSVGHNKNGKPVYEIDSSGNFLLDKDGKKMIDDDTIFIAKNFKKFLNNELTNKDHLGFKIDEKDLNDHIFIPEYYNPEIKQELIDLGGGGKYKMLSFGELLSKGVLQVKRGNEIGSQFYGTGSVPFIRTSDIVNWEMKFDPVKAVSEEIYERYREQQDIRENDILFVSDGTFLIGRTAMVTKLDTKAVIQSHIRKIRVLDQDILDPFFLFYLLNTKIVRKQIESKTFIQATISTIGNRLKEVMLPIPMDINEQKKMSLKIKDIIQKKTDLREVTMEIIECSV